MRISAWLAVIAFFACGHAAHALIVYDTGTDTDNVYNTTLPDDGSPWQYVAEVTNTDPSTDASAVYLGNDFLITANHVTLNSTVTLNGGSFSIDYSFTPMQIGSADLKLFKISGDPGLPVLPLTGPGDNDLDMNSTMIGWGVGKGSVITQSGSNVGWTWGDDSTRAERWGTNVTLSTTSLMGGVVYLQTSFDVSLGPNTASATEGDSGSALFQNFGGVWKLAGIYTTVDTSGASYYANSPNNAGGADNSYAIEIKPYSAMINTLIPEPGTVALSGIGAVALAGFARRRRR